MDDGVVLRMVERRRRYAWLASGGVDAAANDREFVLMGALGAGFVSETGTRSMVLPNGVYLTETS